MTPNPTPRLSLGGWWRWPVAVLLVWLAWPATATVVVRRGFLVGGAVVLASYALAGLALAAAEQLIGWDDEQEGRR